MTRPVGVGRGMWTLWLFACLALCPILANARSQTPQQILASTPAELLDKAEDFQRRQMPDSALKYHVALSATSTPDMSQDVKEMCARSALKAGELYYGHSSYVAAFNSFMRAVRMGKECGSDAIMAEAYKDLGNINATFNDNLQAIYCYKTGLQHARAAADAHTEFSLLVNLAAICTYENSVAEAEDYYSQLRRSSFKSPLLPYFTYIIGGLIHSAKGEAEAAVADYDAAYRFAAANDLDAEYICSIYSEKGKTYSKCGDTIRAIENFRKCADYAGKERVNGMLAESYQSLGDMYAALGDATQAAAYRHKYRTLKDSLMREEEYTRIKGEHFAYEMERSYDDISRLNREVTEGENRARRQHRVILVTLALVVLFLLMACGLYVQNRRLQRAYASIYRKNRELLESGHLNLSITDKGAAQSASQSEATLQSTEKLPDIKKEEILAAIQQVLEHDDEIYNPDFSLDRLAEITSINSRYLSLVVNESMGGNFRSVLNDYRIREAQRRLADSERYGDLTIQGIANSVGYKSYPNFVSAFKRQTGLTPSIYQRTAQKERHTRQPHDPTA